jgi:photosystem II stability/assembly factor-like uncharacterized protein
MEFHRGRSIAYVRLRRPSGSLRAQILQKVILFSSFIFATSISSADDPLLYDAVLAEQNLDACINDVKVVSLDRAFAVGDRGLILATSDGGKNWRKQDSHVTCPLYSVTFVDDRQGWAVGGWPQPHSGRSVGVILGTVDGGRTWSPAKNADIPRLFGIQATGGNQLMAWGDYSSSQQSSVFVSMDNGRTWTSSQIQIGHVHDAAWSSFGQGILIDRLNRVIQVENGIDLSELYVPARIPCRWHAIHFASNGYWLVGDFGQVAHSLDGRRWDVVSLPGTQQDRELMRLRDVRALGAHVWVIGEPGNVIWHSPNAGESWEVQATENQLPLSTIDGVQADRLVVGGAAGILLGTRNGGKGWWTERAVSKRVSMLNVANSRSSAAWYASAVVTNEDRRAAAILLMVPERVESRADILPDYESRADYARSALSLAWVDTMTSPASLNDKPERLQIANVDSTSPIYQAYLRQTVHALRSLQPEVLIVDSISQRIAESAASAKLVLQAEKLAADPEYRLFSPQANIAEKPWKVSKIYASAIAANGKLRFDDSQLIKSTGKLLGHITSPCKTLFATSDSDELALQNSLVLLESSVQSTNAETKIFGGIVLSEEGSRPATEVRNSNYQVLMGTLQRQSAVDRFVATPGPRWRDDPRWKSTLDVFVQASGSSTVGPILLDTARQCRELGYWNRWRACLEQIILREPNSGAAEQAWTELSAFSESDELRIWLATLQNETQPVSVPSAAISIAAQAPVSPFESTNNKEDNASAVQQASYSEVVESSPTVDVRLTGPEKDTFEAPVQIATTSHLESIVPPAMLQNCYQAITVSNPAFLYDLRLQSIQASQFRKSNNPERMSEAQGIYDRMAMNQSIAGWCQIGIQESAWMSQKADTTKTTRIHFIDEQPWLDGASKETAWQSVSSHLLTDPLESKSKPATDIKSAYDATHLYFSIVCPASPDRESLSAKSKQRERDGANRNKDHVVIRLDTDRDYATWFEFVVDEDGQVAEACCGMQAWNPKWFVAHQKESTYWSVEVAIPLSELSEREPSKNDAWAGSFYRQIPGEGTQHDGRVVSDHNLPQGMRLMIFD